MKAIAVKPGTTDVRIVERPLPEVRAADEIKVNVLAVGICGTDREEAAGGRSRAPADSSDLVIGHEMIGRAVEVGNNVAGMHPGDLVVFTVRRGCGACFSCRSGRPDMCATGGYSERGIWGLDGYQAETVVDSEQYAVRIPAELGELGVLTEPMSVAEKAIDEALRVQSSRLPEAADAIAWLRGRRCLIAGLGPIGLLAAVALRLRGAEVIGLDIVPKDTIRPAWLAQIGGGYIDAHSQPFPAITRSIEPFDFIFEATGVAPLEFSLLDALALNGIYVLTGIPGGDRPLEIPGAELMRSLVLKNQAMIGSVNASRAHYSNAVDDLAAACLRWGDHVGRLITHRLPYGDFSEALRHHEDDEIKVVLEWTG